MPRQVKRRRWRLKRAVDFSVVTSYPLLPSTAPPSGRTSITRVSANLASPAFRRDKDNSDRACSWRRGGSPSCSRHRPCRSCVQDLLRQKRGRERWCRRSPLRAPENRNLCRIETVSHAHRVGNSFQQAVGRPGFCSQPRPTCATQCHSAGASPTSSPPDRAMIRCPKLSREAAAAYTHK